MCDERPWDASATLLDVRGLLCPLPVIRTQNRIKDLQSGDLLDVVATDPGTLHDVPAWCRVHGHTIIDTRECRREVWIRLQVQRPAIAPIRSNAS
jgi:tRNA 2-thiouridine synthesizing protein A